jgi:hypothetical protein
MLAGRIFSYGFGLPSAVRCVRHHAGEPIRFGSFWAAVAESLVEDAPDVCWVLLLSLGAPMRVR